MLILMYALFYSTCDYFCVCKMHFFLGGGGGVILAFFVILILVYAFIVLLFLTVKRILMSIMYSAASL